MPSELERPPDAINDEAQGGEPRAPEKRHNGEPNNTTDQGEAQAWRRGVPVDVLALVDLWRALLPGAPLPSPLHRLLASYVAHGGDVRTIPDIIGKAIGAQPAEQPARIAQSLYDALGHDGAAKLAGALVAEVEQRGESARRGAQLLDLFRS